MLNHTLAMHGFKECWLCIVPDVAAAATAEGWPDDSPTRAAKVLHGDHDPIIWMRAEFNDNLHSDLMIGTCLAMTGDWCDEIGARLDDPAAFLCQLLLHEIGHVLFHQGGEDDTEEAGEKWAYDRLFAVLPMSAQG